MIKVAIVEDTTELLHFWTDVLKNTEGYACVGSFSNATDAMENLPTLNADVVLMDIQLSATESGIDIVRALRTQGIHSQFLMFTVFEDDEAIFNSLKAGATGYMLKNSSQSKIIDAIKELFDGGSPMSTGIARRVLESFHLFKASSEYTLLPHEVKVLELLAKGLFYKEVAAQLKVTINTVKQYCHTIYRKLAVSNRTEAVNKYFK